MGHSEHTVIKQMEPALACQVKSKWLHEPMKGIGRGKKGAERKSTMVVCII